MPKTVNQPPANSFRKLALPVIATLGGILWYNTPTDRTKAEPTKPPIPGNIQQTDLSTQNIPIQKTEYSVGFSHKDFLALNSLRDSIANNLNSNAARKAIITYEPESANYVLTINFQLTDTAKETFTNKWQALNRTSPNPATYHDGIEDLPTRKIFHLKIATLQNKTDADKAAKNIINKISPKGLTPNKVKVVKEGNGYSIIYFAASNSALANTQQILDSAIGIKTTQIPDNFLDLADSNNTPALNTLKPSTQIQPPLPITKNLPDEGTANTKLENSIEKIIKTHRTSNKIQPEESIALYVYDITNDKTLVNINAKESLMVASINKLFVVAAFCHAKPTEVEKYDGLITKTLHNSDNDTTNALIDKLGGAENVKAICSQIGIPVDSIERIPPGGRTLNNRATTLQIANFLKKLHSGTLPGSKKIKSILCTNPSRIAAGITGKNHQQGKLLGKAKQIFGKTGTTLQCIGDSQLVITSDGRALILSGIITRPTPSSEKMKAMQERLGGSLRILGAKILE